MLDILFTNFSFGMSEEEVNKEIKKLGFQLGGSSTSESGVVSYHYYKESQNTNLLFFFSKNRMNHKAIMFNEILGSKDNINQLLEKYRANYLKLVGMNFEEYSSEPTNNHGAIFFVNERYSGQVQVGIFDGVVQVTYGLKEGSF